MNRKTVLIIVILIACLSGCVIHYFFDFSIWQYIINKQREINQIIITHVQTIKNDGFNGAIIFRLFLFSILYGVIHAIGPGHGKTLLSTYLLRKEKGYLTALSTSTIASIAHIGSAVILAFMIKYIFVGIGHFARMNMISYFGKVNGGLIAILGMIFILTALSNNFNLHSLSHKAQNDKMIGILAGFVPCPASMSIILVSIYLSVAYVGLVSVGGIVIGIFFTLLVIQLLTILFKDQLLNTLKKYKLKGEKIGKYISIFQGMCFICLGIMFFRY
ncbi:MAG: hypothetical protein KAQ98_08650 [Bacteriovoracaceae bacterium]|nr:hypothetical protein [Bacteriovoracaceae bacterium]